jgi:hypothetical protein
MGLKGYGLWVNLIQRAEPHLGHHLEQLEPQLEPVVPSQRVFRKVARHPHVDHLQRPPNHPAKHLAVRQRLVVAVQAACGKQRLAIRISYYRFKG